MPRAGSSVMVGRGRGGGGGGGVLERYWRQHIGLLSMIVSNGA